MQLLRSLCPTTGLGANVGQLEIESLRTRKRPKLGAMTMHVFGSGAAVLQLAQEARSRNRIPGDVVE